MPLIQVGAWPHLVQEMFWERGLQDLCSKGADWQR